MFHFGGFRTSPIRHRFFGCLKYIKQHLLNVLFVFQKNHSLVGGCPINCSCGDVYLHWRLRKPSIEIESSNKYQDDPWRLFVCAPKPILFASSLQKLDPFQVHMQGHYSRH